MIGLFFLLLFVPYILFSIWITKHAYRACKKRGISGFWGGVPVTLIMYNLVFWDLIPTMISHKHHCSTEAGFFVYKDLDQWKSENSGVFETLSLNNLSNDDWTESYSLLHGTSNDLLPDGSTLHPKYDVKGDLMYVEYQMPDGSKGYQLNERFRYSLKDHIRSTDEKELFMNVWRWQKEVTDSMTGEILAREVNFTSGNDGYIGGGVGDRSLKFWLNSATWSIASGPYCSRSYFPNGYMSGYIKKTRKLGE